MADHESCIHERVIALVEKGELSASTVDELYGIPVSTGMIHLQQDLSSIHDSRVVQEWLWRQADVELLDWPPPAPDMNPIENMWSEMKRTMQETCPVLPPRNSVELWALVSGVWDEVASSTCYIHSLIESMTRMKLVVEAEGFWTAG